ncbi:alpha/beta-hydrolase [Macrolepiota fuliginosa MF-IS2]|uniref:Alpha/beta-hydrolase n=1 Tax=Macrolepiota fuliginosa MF-IS2 TaxID=1400762 RepID=A0A9P5XCU4_9AGAR|nr:alpha/beta-hydrolase [Macrolepiota fuliginosa MF-IS2]
MAPERSSTSSTMVSSPYYHCLTFSLLLIPPLIFASYLLSAFPNPPETLNVHPSLASLPPNAKSWQIYPEDYYEGGAYVDFPYGRVRYWVMGPENGKKVVLIHGLSIPTIVWKDVAPRLAAKGYRVLLYDLYGRGYSDAPQTTYHPGLFTTQLALLMQHLKWDKAIIVGVSMGGGVAAAFTAHFPELVDGKVVLIASAGLVENGDISRTAKFMSSPLVQTLASSMPFRIYLQHLTNSTSKAGDEADPIIEIVRLQSAHLPGYNAAISSSLRDGPIRGQAAMFSSSGFEGKKVLLIHGTKDATVHPKYSPRIISLLPEKTRSTARLVTVDDAGHEVITTHSGIVTDELVKFFKEK